MTIDEFVVSVSYRLGFTAKQIVTLPWELVPYSFVIDWFANVGDFLGAMADFALSEKALGSCVVGRWDIQESYNLLTTVSSNPYYTFDRIPYGSIVAKAILKARSPGLSGPGLVVKSNFRLDEAIRIADALSLVEQALIRRFR